LQIFDSVNFYLVNLYGGPRSGHKKNEIYRANMPLSHALSIDDGWLCNQTNQGLDGSNIVEQGSIMGSISVSTLLSQRLKIGFDSVNVVKNWYA